MHAEALDGWRHEHVFLGAQHARNERRSWAVVMLCGTMMVAEIAGGWLWGSIALIADGLHMSTHAGALVIAAAAYSYGRRHANDERFSFGTGKLGDLAGFASAIVLARTVRPQRAGGVFEQLGQGLEPRRSIVSVAFERSTCTLTNGEITKFNSSPRIPANHRRRLSDFPVRQRRGRPFRHAVPSKAPRRW
jgi:hypothetical protein